MMRTKFLGILGLITLLATFDLTSMVIRSPMLPRVYQIISKSVSVVNSGEIIPHIIDSLKIVICGFSLAVVLGFLAGIAINKSRIFEFITMPVIDMIRSVAALAVFPLFILILGIGFKSKVLTIFWTAWPAICLNTITALRGVSKDIIEAARIEGAGEIRILKSISVPVSATTILTGLRIGMSGGWISLVAAEMLGSNSGLGFYVLMKSQSFDFTGMYAAILYISLIGLIANQILYYFERKLSHD